MMTRESRLRFVIRCDTCDEDGDPRLELDRLVVEDFDEPELDSGAHWQRSSDHGAARVENVSEVVGRFLDSFENLVGREIRHREGPR